MHTFQNIRTALSFSIFAFLLPWQTTWILREPFIHGEKWHYGTIGIKLSLIFLFIWIVSSLLQKDRREIARNYLKTRANIFLLAFSTWILASALWSADTILAISVSLTFFLGVACLFLISHAEQKLFLGAFFVSMTVQSCLGLWQFFLQDVSFSSSLLGVSAHEAWRGGSSVIEGAGRWIRAYGGFPHPNIFGGFLAISLLLGTHDFITATTQKKRLLLLSAIAILFSALLVTFSRSAWTGLVIGEIVLFAYMFRTFSIRHLFRLSASEIILATGVIVLFFTGYTALFLTRSGTYDIRLETKSLNDRVLYIQEAKEIIRSNSFFGTGIGNYTRVLNDLHSNEPIWQHQPVHNIPLLLWAETGVIGTVLFSLGIFSSIRSALRQPISSQKATVIGCLTIIGWIALFDHWAWTNTSGTLLLFVLLSIVALKK